MTNQSGQSAHQYFYTPYGRLLDNNGKLPDNIMLSDSSNFTGPHNQYTLTGKPLDAESGLTYFGARYYDAASGTWLTRDPLPGSIPNAAGLTQVSPALGAAFFDAHSFTTLDTQSTLALTRGSLSDPLGRNRYLFNRANPLSFIDPTGSAVVVDTGGGGGPGGCVISNHPWLCPPPTGGGSNPPPSGGGNPPPTGGGGNDPDPGGDIPGPWEPYFPPAPPPPPLSNGPFVFGSIQLGNWLPRATQKWVDNMHKISSSSLHLPGLSDRAVAGLSTPIRLDPRVSSALHLSREVSTTLKWIDWRAGLAEDNPRHPDLSAARTGLANSLNTAFRTAIPYIIDRHADYVQHIAAGQWSAAAYDRVRLDREVYTPMTVGMGKTAGSMVVGMITAPYRFVTQSFPHYLEKSQQYRRGEIDKDEFIWSAETVTLDAFAAYGTAKIAQGAVNSVQAARANAWAAQRFAYLDELTGAKSYPSGSGLLGTGKPFLPATNPSALLGRSQTAILSSAKHGNWGWYDPGLSPQTAQGIITDIANNELAGVKFSYPPRYDPGLIMREGEAVPGFSSVGPSSFTARSNVIDTMLHEELHQRLWARGNFAPDAVVHPYIDDVIERFFGMEGWK